jgi:hypothetical protein
MLSWVRDDLTNTQVLVKLAEANSTVLKNLMEDLVEKVEPAV